MLWIIAGCFAFVLLFIFDGCKMKGYMRFTGILFFAGVVIILISTAAIAKGGQADFALPTVARLFALFLAALSAGFMIYALFFALPFGKTYTKPEQNQVVSKGFYALCRHPGVIFFGFMYIFLWLATGKNTMLAAALAWTLMDVFHVWVQDIVFFPKTIRGYDEYKKHTPFLIPTKESLKKCLKDIA